MGAYTLDRKCEYLGVKYRILEVLASDMVVVVKIEDYEKADYPMCVSVIPENLIKIIY